MTSSMGSSMAVLAFVAACCQPSHVNAQLSVFIERGVCPGEACTYTVWRARSIIPVRETPTDSLQSVRAIEEGELVCALTGEVHTVPGHFVAEREHGRYEQGDTIVVYTYRGEGRFLVEFDGERYEEDLGFSPWGGTPGSRCELGATCWGKLESDLNFEWWIRTDNLAGTVGWVLGNDAFDIRVETAADPAFFSECERRRREGGQMREARSESHI